MSNRQGQSTPTTDEAAYQLLASAVHHPTRVHPYRTVFNERSLETLQSKGVRLDVVSPTPFAPPVGPYSEYSELPTVESRRSYRVHHPRFLYLLPKRYFYHVSGDSLSKRLTRYAERNLGEPDVLHACSIYLDGYGLLRYAKRHDVPLFVVAHGDVLLYYDTFSSRVRARIAETLDRCARVLCVSEDFVERVEELTDPSKVELLPIGADPGNFPTGRERQLRAEFGLDDDTTVVLFCGQFTERKGVREIAQAVSRLEGEDVAVVCIGHSGDLEEELARGLARSDARTVLERGATTSELRKWFAVADLLLLPSYAEGRPTVIYEAMASETAVLGSNAGGIPEQVEDGRTGVLLPPGDPEALAGALDELVSDPSRLRRMGRRGHERLVEQGWTWDQHAERLRELHLQELRGERPTTLD